MDSSYIGITVTVLIMVIHIVLGCSPEAWVEPTLKSKARYAEIIAIGTVKRIIQPDPADILGQTYGAKVMVQCSYKGGHLPGMITIGGAGISYGCSPEAWVTPTLESKAHYADIIAIGEVTRIDPKDPGNFVGNTYGAYVQVQCTYKGGLLGDVIEIGGVGFIEGHCDSKELKVNTRYILFLDNKQEGRTWYLQSGAAEPANRDKELVQMCNMTMEYPMENGITLPRPVCRPATTSKSCKQYKEPKDISGRKPVIEAVLGEGAETTTPAGGASSVIASLGLFVTSFILSLV